MDLKEALLESPALRAIDYTSPSPVILAIDTSHIAVGFHLCQCDPENPRKRYYNCFGSITLNDREARFSQPKLEIYGLYWSLCALCLYLIGIRNLVIEVDARYIKGMLQNPDITPSASINRWIVSILTFHFTLVHVAGSHHGPDGLSRRPRQPDDDPSEEDDNFEDWIDNLHGFVHHVNDILHPPTLIPQISSFVGTQSFSEEENHLSPDSYDIVPRSKNTKSDDLRLQKVFNWLQDLVRPADLSDSNYATFIRYCTEFFINSNKLWRKDTQGSHKLVAFPDWRLEILRSCHNGIGHKSFFATRAHIAERFWWPHMHADIVWFVRTCLLCQQHQTRQILIPPVVATPAPLFAKVYIDTMHMPPSRLFKYIVQGRCSLTQYPEFHMLRSETAQSLGNWIYEDILCRWGSL